MPCYLRSAPLWNLKLLNNLGIYCYFHAIAKRYMAKLWHIQGQVYICSGHFPCRGELRGLRLQRTEAEQTDKASVQRANVNYILFDDDVRYFTGEITI